MKRNRGPLVIGAVVLLALAALALAGGFATAADRGRTVAGDSPIHLARWTVQVDGCSWTDRTLAGSPADPVLRIAVRLTNTTEETASPTPQLFSLLVDGQQVTTWSEAYGGDRSYGYDPGVGRAGSLDFPWPVDPAASATPPDRVRLVVSDEHPRVGLATGRGYAVGSPVAGVDLACADDRQGDG